MVGLKSTIVTIPRLCIGKQVGRTILVSDSSSTSNNNSSDSSSCSGDSGITSLPKYQAQLWEPSEKENL